MVDAQSYPRAEAVSAVRDSPAAVAVSSSKRVMDLFVAISLLIFLSPLLLIIAIAVTRDSTGPALFQQKRTGLNGKIFTIYKFRTMMVMEDGLGLAHATPDDTRVTKFGRFLRRSSLDELPQLYNVLKGDMSMVGPRPHAVDHDNRYALLVPGYWERFRARPGLTGLAQVAGLRGGETVIGFMAQRVAMDLDYISRWTLWLDALIILRTIPALIIARNAY